MADTYGDMVNEIVAESRRSMSSTIEGLILDSIAYYQSEPFWFNRQTQTFSISSSQDTYTSVDASFIPRIMSFDTLRLTVSSSDQPTLDKYPWEMLEDMNYPTSRGQPVAYAYWGQSIRFYPIPDTGYEVRFSGVVQDTSLSLSTDVNNWTQRGKGKDLIKFRTASLLYATYLRDDMNAGRCAGLERQALEQIRLRTARLQGTGEIQPCL